MTFFEKITILERVDSLIRRKATGSASELANRLGISRRSVYDIINIMKMMDAPIVYDNIRKTFVYEYECELSIGFVAKDKVLGGSSNIFQNYFWSASFLHKFGISL